MKAVPLKGKNKVAVEEVPNPKIEAPDDAVIRIATAAICGSDLHMYEQRSSAEPGIVFGHPLSKAPEAYARFVWRSAGEGRDFTKIVLKPALDKAA